MTTMGEAGGGRHGAGDRRRAGLFPTGALQTQEDRDRSEVFPRLKPACTASEMVFDWGVKSTP